MKRYLFVLLLVLGGLCAACTQGAPQAPRHAATVPSADAGPAATAAPEPQLFTLMATQDVPLLQAAAADAPVLTLLTPGTFVELLGEVGGYAHIRVYGGGQTGYLPLANLLAGMHEPAMDHMDADMTPGAYYSAQVQEYLSLRLAADTAAERIAKLPAQTLLRVLDAQDGFARVEVCASGERGYVLQEYLVLSAEQQPPAPAPAQTGMHAVLCRQYISLRAQPDTGAPRIAKLTPGMRVQVIAHTNGFAQVDVAGTQLSGYVLGDYLTPTDRPAPAPGADADTPPGPQPQRWLVRCQEYLTLRARPDPAAPALQRLPDGQALTLAGFTALYAQVSLPDGSSGYVLSGYIEPEQPDPCLAALDIIKPVEKYPYAQMMADLTALQERYPQQLRVETAGASLQGRAIPVAVVGDPGARRHVLIQAGIHGREHMTSLLAMAQLEYILACPDAPFADGTVQSWLRGVCLHILPMTNPDGVRISQRTQATDSLRAIYQSDVAAGYAAGLPLRAYLRQWKANAAGIDLNRNFDAGWAGLSGPEAPSFARYKGAAPADQPESQALAQYTRRYAFGATLSYHAYGSCIYWQFGDKSDAIMQSKDLARALSAVTQYPLVGADGLDAGGYKDWAIEQLGVPSVTVEIGARDCPLPLTEFAAIWQRNCNMLPALARWVGAR